MSGQGNPRSESGRSSPADSRRNPCAAAVWRLAGLALPALAMVLPAVAAQAEVKTVTLTRAGANSTTLSVSNNATGGYHSQMHYALVDNSADSCSGSGVTYGNASSTWSAGSQTYSKTVTGNAGTYVCIRGTAQIAARQATVSVTKGSTTITATLGSSLAEGTAGNSWELVITRSGNDEVDATNKQVRINQSTSRARPEDMVGWLNALSGVSASQSGSGYEDWQGTYSFSGGLAAVSNRSDYSTPQGPIAYPGPTLSLNSAGNDNQYQTGDNIDITAAFGYNVTADTTSGTPRIALSVGSNARYATYHSGTGSGNLKFRYTVVAADTDPDGVSIAANALSLNSGTLQDSGGTNAVITHAAVAASSTKRVNTDTTAPTVSFNPANGAHLSTNSGNITLTFSEAVYKDSSQSTFTATDLESLVELKTSDDNGTSIDFAATIAADTVVTVNPDANLADGDVYVEVGNGFYDAAGNQGSSANATFTVDTTAPTATLSPANGTTVQGDVKEGVTVIFDDPVYSDASRTAFTDTTAAGIITLKAGSSTAADIAFIAQIDRDYKTISVHPVDSQSNVIDLSTGSVFLAVSNAYYNGAGLQGSAASVTFTVDATAPKLSTTTNPSVAGKTLTLTFDEALDTTKVPDKSAFTLTARGGPTVSSVAVSGSTATLTLSQPVPAPRNDKEKATLDYTAPASNALQDAVGNKVASFSGQDVAIDTSAVVPTVTISPADGSRSNASGVTLTFSEAVYSDRANTAFDATSAATLVKLKQTDSNGTAINFTAAVTTTGTNANKVVTITPSSTWPDGYVYVEVGGAFYDVDGNAGRSKSASFRVDTVAPTLDSASVNGSTLTATFSEALDTSKKAASGAFTLDVTGTNDDPTVSSYTMSGATATMTLSDAVTSNQTLTITYTQPTGSATKIADLAGNALASIPAGSEISVTNDTGTSPPTVTFSPANGALIASSSGNITLTFSEPVYKDTSATAFVDSDLGTLVELKRNNDNGLAIAFAATINAAKTVVTVNPSANLADGRVYVEVGSGFYDVDDNHGSRTSATFTVDTTAPTVSSAAYYRDAATSTSLSGTVKSGSDVYTKVTFSEAVGHTAGSGASARPEINFKIGSGSDVQYDIVANSAILLSGECRPSTTPPASVYVCHYQVGGSDSGTLGFEVDTGTADEAGNTLTAVWTPIATLTLEPAPLFGTTIADRSYKVGTAIATLTLPAASGGDSGTTLTYTLSPALPAGLTFSAANRTITGTPSTATANTEYTYTVTETDGDAASLTFKIAVAADAPTVAFSPVHGSLISTNSGDITLAFGQSVYQDASATPFTESDLATLIELKRNHDNGAAIAFTASINAGYSVVTVNPSANLPEGRVYVEVGSGFYDADGNQGAKTSATFWVDTTAPTLDSASVHGRTLTVTFSENLDPSKKAAASAFTIDVAGTNDDPSVSSYTLSGDTATMTLNDAVAAGQTLTITYAKPSGNDAKIADLAGHELASIPSGSEVSVTNNASATAPTVTFSPASGAVTRNRSSNVTLTFSEAVYKDASATPFDVPDLRALIELKATDDNGAALGFGVSIDAANTVVTVNPTGVLADGDVYVEVGSGFYDAAGLQGAATSATFEVDTVGARVLTAVSGYYSDAAASTEITAGTVRPDVTGTTVEPNDDVYMLVVFDDVMNHVDGSSRSSRRPVIGYWYEANNARGYRLADFKNVAANATLKHGECKPMAAVTNYPLGTRYVCRYTVPSGGGGDFGYVVWSTSLDKAGNPLAHASLRANKKMTRASSDTTPPTVSSAAYYSDAATSIALSGTVKSGNDVYTKVTFSETVGHTAGDGAGARPEINYTIGSGSDVQYHIVANTATLASGDCKPGSAPPASVYVCRYQVGGSDSGALGFEVDTGTADEAGNALASAWTPNTTLTLEPAPLFGTTIANQSYTVGTAISTLTLPAATGGDANTTLTYTLSPALPTGLSFSATNRTISGTPSAVSAEREYTYTVTESDDDAASLTFKITVTDSTAPALSSMTPAHGARVSTLKPTITLTFSEAVYSDASGTEFTDAKAAELVSMRWYGIPYLIAYTATINDDNTVITITPTTSLNIDQGNVVVGVGSGYYDAAGNQGSAHSNIFVMDTTRPTVSSAKSGYYQDAAATKALSGVLGSGTDIYTKIRFSENVKHVAGSGNTARPAISYSIAGTETQYTIVAFTTSPASGTCTPFASNRTNDYLCRYTVVVGDDGTFDFRVGTATQDAAEPPRSFAATYTHVTTLTVDTLAPTVTGGAYHETAAATTVLTGPVLGGNDISQNKR